MRAFRAASRERARRSCSSTAETNGGTDRSPRAGAGGDADDGAGLPGADLTAAARDPGAGAGVEQPEKPGGRGALPADLAVGDGERGRGAPCARRTERDHAGAA